MLRKKKKKKWKRNFIDISYNYNTKKKIVSIIDHSYSDKIDYNNSYLLDCKNSNLYGYNFVKL